MEVYEKYLNINTYVYCDVISYVVFEVQDDKIMRFNLQTSVANVRTTKFKIKKFYVVFTLCICVFHMDIRKTAIIFPFSILVFIT
jgi:hypothetical protein